MMHYYNITVSALFSRVSGEVCDQPAVCCLHRRRLSSQEVRQLSGLVSVTLRTVGQRGDIHLILISNMIFGIQRLENRRTRINFWIHSFFHHTQITGRYTNLCADLSAHHLMTEFTSLGPRNTNWIIWLVGLKKKNCTKTWHQIKSTGSCSHLYFLLRSCKLIFLNKSLQANNMKPFIPWWMWIKLLNDSSFSAVMFCKHCRILTLWRGIVDL